MNLLLFETQMSLMLLYDVLSFVSRFGCIERTSSNISALKESNFFVQAFVWKSGK